MLQRLHSLHNTLWRRKLPKKNKQFWVYTRTKSAKEKETLYHVIIPIPYLPANTYINLVYNICTHLIRNSSNTFFFLSLYLNSYSTCKPTKVCDTYLYDGTQHYDMTRKFSQTTQARAVFPYQIREKRRGIILLRKRYIMATRNMDDRYLEILFLALPNSRWHVLTGKHRESKQHATLNVWRREKTMISTAAALVVVVVLLLVKTTSRRRAVASGCCRHCRTAVGNWW